MAFSEAALCQTGFKPGYIITLSNDTVAGEILYSSNQKNHKVCTFISKGSTEKKEYSPSELAAYRFDDGKYYISKRVPVYRDTMLLFTEFILQGRASLYYVTINGNNHYYIETSEGLLELTESVITDNTKTKIIRSRIAGRLRASLSDCPEIMPEIDNVEMNHKSLIKLGQDYHRLTCDDGDCIVFERTVKPVIFSFGIHAGYSNSYLNFGKELCDKGADGFIAGVTAEWFNIVSRDERFGARIDMLLQYNRTLNIKLADPLRTGPYSYVTYENKGYVITSKEGPFTNPFATNSLKADLKILILKIPVTLNWNFGNEKWHYSLGVGPVCSFTLSQNPEFYYATFYSEYGKTIPFFFFGGIGKGALEYRVNNKYSLVSGFSYDIMSNTNMNEHLRLNFRSLGINLGIRF